VIPATQLVDITDLASTKDTIYMAKRSPAEVIESYRNHQGHRTIFTFANISQALLLLIILASTVYVALTGGPEIPTLVDLKTNTPTYTPSITPTPTQTATITPTSTETPEPRNQCDCPATVVIVITATFSDTNTPAPLPTATETATIAFTSTASLTPTDTPTPTITYTPTATFTPTASVTPTPTQIIYTVKAGDTLSYIAFRFGVTVEAIQTLNNLDTTLIYVGQVLQIPRP